MSFIIFNLGRFNGYGSNWYAKKSIPCKIIWY